MKILVIPDTQVKPGVSLDHLDWLASYIVDKKPDVILQIGDFADMESLSSYDVGKKSFEGRSYAADIDAAFDGMKRLIDPVVNHQIRNLVNKKKAYNPKLILTLGNHENRIDRAIENDRKLDGLISVDDLPYALYGFTVVPFLQPIVINGVAFNHYFPTGVMGRPSATANAQLNKQHMSCVAGHQQGFQMATGRRADGKAITSIIAGSCYLHDEAFMGHVGNMHWRGALMLHNVEDGEFDVVQIPLHYLERKYG
jgi:hypothetical protein